MADNFYIALLHYPVYNKHGEVVTTAVTNMDVHDIARAALTYGVKRFYIVTPILVQRQLVAKIMQHWQQGYGSIYNPARREALQIADIKGSLDEVLDDVAGNEGKKPWLVATGANLAGKLITFRALRVRLREESDAHLLLFGTGWGMAQQVLERADFFLESIRGVMSYNHLSVRSAVSIALDRLWGEGTDGDVH